MYKVRVSESQRLTPPKTTQNNPRPTPGLYEFSKWIFFTFVTADLVVFAPNQDGIGNCEKVYLSSRLYLRHILTLLTQSFSLSLSLNRPSATGEGIFQFFTKHGDTIADELRLQSQHAFKSAAEKRDAFRMRSSSTGSDSKSPTPVHPVKKLPRTFTAPPDRFANALMKKGRGVSMDSMKRSRADTDPSAAVQKAEQNSPAVAANGAADGSTNGSASNPDTRPRSSTASSVDKGGDDEVFLSQPAYSVIDNSESIQEETDVNAYIDLLSDDTAEPVHISDPVPSRKISNESQTSLSSIASDEGSMRTNSLPRNFSGAQLIPEENEMDSEGYIKCEALQTDGNGNVVDFFESDNPEGEEERELSSAQVGLPKSPVDITTLKSGSLELSSANSRINRKMRENLVAQIRDPSGGTFPPKPKLERERPLKSENAFPPKSRTEEAEPPTDCVDSAHALLEQARDPESSKKLLDQIIAQMEKPQQHDVSELFPAATRKRNSIGAMSMETVREAQKRAAAMSSKASHSNSFSYKKHTVIEKSKSTCDGFSPRALSPGPPPLPIRPDSSEVTRRRACSSVGDISEDLHKRPDLTGAPHRSTFFAKGMRGVNPQTLMSPIRTNISAGHLGGEAAIHARLIEKTEIRDELAQSSTAKNKIPGDDTSTCVIANGGASCTITDETIDNSADSLEKCRVKSTENLDEDAQGDMSKRKDSKASKFVKKVWKLAPKPRRGSNESRETCEEYSPPSDRPRRESLSPGDAIDLQGRFSGSEPNTPDSSPTMRRKNSKTLPKDSRKISTDEKSKKDKESSASKMLRKMTKSDLKKDESCQKSPVRKISKEESPKKDGLSTDSATKPLSPKHIKASSPEKARKDSRDEKAKGIRESIEMTDRFHRDDGQLERAPNVTESRRTPTKDVEDPAPALPPRKKFEPPPLPPRLSKSSPSLSSIASPVHATPPHPPHHGTRVPQPSGPSSREGRRHGSSRRPSGSGLKEEFLPPPPVPPRNSQSPEPKNVPASNERSSARAPVIQLTCSSPENRDDALKKLSSGECKHLYDVISGFFLELKLLEVQ